MLALEQVRGVWTVDDLRELDVEDWRRFEIVDGSLLVSPPPGMEHEFVIADLRAVLDAQLPSALAVLGSPGIELGRSYLVPDAVVVPRSIRGSRSGGYFRPEDVLLVVEVVSPGSVSMDRLVKPAKYAAAGISAYWRVETDPVGLTAYVLPPGSDTYVESGSWGVGETVTLTEPFAVRLDIDSLAR